MRIHHVAFKSVLASRAVTAGRAMLLVAAVLAPWLMPTANADLSASALPPCPVMAKMPVRSVEPAVVRVVQRYYAQKHLTPIAIIKHQETILNVVTQRVGVHYCTNTGGGKSGYVGAVPKNAVAAVMVYVRHKPYPVTQSPANFVTLARLPRIGWKVVSEGTGP